MDDVGAKLGIGVAGIVPNAEDRPPAVVRKQAVERETSQRRGQIVRKSDTGGSEVAIEIVVLVAELGPCAERKAVTSR